MIPSLYVTHWRNHCNWPLDELVEQDLIISKILLDLYQDPLIKEQLVFRGGTALYKLYLKDSLRYSEDIDLVRTSTGPIRDIINKIKSIIDPWLGPPTYSRNEGRFTLYYSFLTENEPKAKKKIKIEINTREHFSVLGYVEQPFSIESPWITGKVLITTYKLEELLATKLRALFQRRKGRDLFDLGVALKNPLLDIEQLLTCFYKYTDSKITRAQFEQNLQEKITDIAFSQDIQKLLPINSTLLQELKEHPRLVYEKLIKNLVGNPWKGKFESFL